MICEVSENAEFYAVFDILNDVVQFFNRKENMFVLRKNVK